jgi:hypothetical protein
MAAARGQSVKTKGREGHKGRAAEAGARGESVSDGPSQPAVARVVGGTGDLEATSVRGITDKGNRQRAGAGHSSVPRAALLS